MTKELRGVPEKNEAQAQEKIWHWHFFNNWTLCRENLSLTPCNLVTKRYWVFRRSSCKIIANSGTSCIWRKLVHIVVVWQLFSNLTNLVSITVSRISMLYILILDTLNMKGFTVGFSLNFYSLGFGCCRSCRIGTDEIFLQTQFFLHLSKSKFSITSLNYS